MPDYEIYAVKYAGPFTSSGAFLMWMRDWDVTMERAYYFWVLKSPERVVVIDAGLTPELASERNLAGYVHPLRLLADIDIQAEDVLHLVLTHMHWDHVNGVSLFPNARIYVQKEEYRFWTRDPMAERPAIAQLADNQSRAYLSTLEGTERLEFLDGDQEILPGVKCLLTPGHSVANQAVAVTTEKGRAIVGSDCGHTFKNYEMDWPSTIIFDLQAWLRSFDKLKLEASDPSLIFPGHDILMSTEFPEIAPGITRLV